MPKAADFSAIYGIRHIASGRIYVGSAVRTRMRAGVIIAASYSAARTIAATCKRHGKKKSQEPLMGYELRTKLADGGA